MSTNRLQKELKKRDGFASLEQEAYLNLARTHDQLHIRFERLFREHGLTPAQYNILRILRGEGTPLPILEIAGRTIAVVPGITGLIDRLEKAGLVKRMRSTEDRRVIFVEVTTEGEGVLNKLDKPVADLERDLLKALDRDELRLLIGLLEKVRDGVNPEKAPTTLIG